MYGYSCDHEIKYRMSWVRVPVQGVFRSTVAAGFDIQTFKDNISKFFVTGGRNHSDEGPEPVAVLIYPYTHYPPPVKEGQSFSK